MHPIKYMNTIEYNKDAGQGCKSNGLQPSCAIGDASPLVFNQSFSIGDASPLVFKAVP
jgi:hypothetical protein